MSAPQSDCTVDCGSLDALVEQACAHPHLADRDADGEGRHLHYRDEGRRCPKHYRPRSIR